MADDELPIVELFTDGACRGNPGPGGWGYVMRLQGRPDTEQEHCGGAEETTNNRMEMQAVIEGLKALNKRCEVILVTDSKYVLDGLTSWVTKWRKRNWKRPNGDDVKNRELWEELARQTEIHAMRYEWVKGHANHPENERADKLANQGIDEMQTA